LPKVTDGLSQGRVSSKHVIVGWIPCAEAPRLIFHQKTTGSCDMKKPAMAILAALGASAALAAPVNQVGYATLTGTEIVDFDDITGGPAPGQSYDTVFASRGVGLGEHFVGQTVTSAGDFDQLGGAPTGPLTLVAGAAGHNLNVFTYNGSNALDGLGTAGFPDFSAIGEGAFALTFSSDQSEFGFQLVGGNGGQAFIDFFRADGSLISSVTVSGLAEAYYGFSREGGIKDIRGISIWNNDEAGIGFDNLKHDVRSNVPEPESYALMLAGLLTAGGLACRRRGA
jgi:hypothetical protein